MSVQQGDRSALSGSEGLLVVPHPELWSTCSGDDCAAESSRPCLQKQRESRCVYPCTSVGNWLLILQLPKERGTVKCIGVRCRKGGLQPQERAPQRKIGLDGR